MAETIDYSQLTPQEAADLLAQRKAEIAQLRQITKGTPADKAATGGTVNKVLSTANANARAEDVLARAQQRVKVTGQDHDAAVTAYLQRYNLEAMPQDLVDRIAASRAKAIENLTIGREKISTTLKGRTKADGTAETEDSATEDETEEAAD